MEALLTVTFLTSLLSGAVTAGVPLLLAGLGEQISEKAGVLNIGLEGMAVALLMALFCIRLAMNQIVIGISLTLGAEGLTALLHHFQFSQSYPRLDAAPPQPIPFLADIPVVGRALFQHHEVVYLAVAAVAVVSWIFRHTYIGLNLEAAGQKPAALDTAGISVDRTRTGAVLATGFLAGVGGA